MQKHETPAPSATREKLYPLTGKILRLASNIFIHLFNLVRGGVLITGSPGSGKSSGSFETLLRSCLIAGHGAFIMCCKADSVTDAWHMAEAAYRDQDVIFVRPKSHTFRFIDYAIAHHDEPESVISECVEALFSALEPLRNDLGKSSGENPFFSMAGKRLIGKLMLIDRLAEGSINLDRLQLMIQSIPPTIQSLEEPERFFVLRQIEKARKAVQASQERELERAIEHLAVELVNLNHETKSSITITATTELDPLLEYPLFEMFNGNGEKIDPEVVLDGKIVILDIPIAKYPVAGKIAGSIWKRSVQNAILRRMARHRGDPDLLIPVGIWADEAAHWVSPFDARFASLCRAARGYLVYTSQSVNSMVHALGGGETGKTAFEELAANLQVRIAHANLCPASNGFHAESLGKVKVKKITKGETENLPARPGSPASKGTSTNYSEVEEYELPPRASVGLLTGGYANHEIIEGIVILGGEWLRDHRYMKVRFLQNSWGGRHFDALKRKEPTAVCWVGYVSWDEVLKGFLEGRERGMELFYRWANFWNEGHAFPTKPGGHCDGWGENNAN